MIIYVCFNFKYFFLKAVWYTEDTGNLGPVFGAADNWKGMGLFFDSYDNDGEVCSFYFTYKLRTKCLIQYQGI